MFLEKLSEYIAYMYILHANNEVFIPQPFFEHTRWYERNGDRRLFTVFVFQFRIFNEYLDLLNNYSADSFLLFHLNSYLIQ